MKLTASGPGGRPATAADGERAGRALVGLLGVRRIGDHGHKP